jgi:hypothetical protein
VAALIEDLAHWPALPVGPLQEVGEVEAPRMFGLTHLPVLPGALALQILAEPPHLVGHRFIGRRPRQESPHPPDAVRRRVLLHQARFEDELAELLQRRLEFSHDSAPSCLATATSMPFDSWCRNLSGPGHNYGGIRPAMHPR